MKKKGTHYIKYKENKKGEWTWTLYMIKGDKALCKSSISYSACYNAERGAKNSLKGLNAVINFPVKV